MQISACYSGRVRKGRRIMHTIVFKIFTLSILKKIVFHLLVLFVTFPFSLYLGLKMTLLIEQSEYLSLFGSEAGVRVSINAADTIALPSDEGITIRPGTRTSIGLRYVRVTVFLFSFNFFSFSFCLNLSNSWQNILCQKVYTSTICVYT